MPNQDGSIDIKFTRPDSYVVSVRLNAEESRALTSAARRAAEKLSTFIKAAALETIARRSATGGEYVLLGDRGNDITIRTVVGMSVETGAQGSTGGSTAAPSWEAREAVA